MPKKRTVLRETERLSGVPIEERLDRTGYFSPSTLALCFNRTNDEIFYHCAKGWLGKPRLAGKRKVYSLAQAETLYRQLISPDQIKLAVAQARNDRIIALAEALRRLRDVQWRVANKNTVNLIEPPLGKADHKILSEIDGQIPAEASL